MMLKQKFINDHNPSTGEVIEKIKISSPGEVASNVKLARKAYKTWSELSLKNRVKIIRKIEKDLLKEKKKIADTISSEMGKIYKSSQREMLSALESINTNIKLSEKIFRKEIYKSKSLITEVYRVPIGVVAVITPWNFPFEIPISLIVQALLTGNSVVFKPSEYSPLTGKIIFEIFNKHLSKGVINIIQGAEEVGEILLQSDIDMVTFVGSREVGKKVMSECSNRLNRLILELGGKDPMLVLKDADLSSAAEFAVSASIRNCGQICTSIERIYVEDKIAGKFEKLVLEKIKKIKVGNVYDNVDIGPMANEAQRSEVLNQVDEARRKGARILYGGNKVESNGYFIEPTLIVDASEKHNIMTEETFGPVVSIQRVRNANEAIEKANKSRFGLGATIWTKNHKRAMEIASKIETGMIGINGGVGGVSGTPWIGIKESGFGFHGGVDGLKQFTNPKKVTYKKKI